MKILLFKTEFHAFGFFGATLFADDGADATLALADWFFEALFFFRFGDDAALKNFAVEATDNVLARFVLIFTGNFD